MIDRQVPVPQAQAVKELRLAVVCYGGVSLAIYMHGITKELHKLVRASEAFNADGGAANPFPEASTERAYWNALEAIRSTGVSTRVVVDVIAGTSAGGINGICLAKALAGDRSQDALRGLWIDKGDIGLLMRGWRRLPWKLRLPFLLLPPRRPLLRGDEMCQWLFDAFQAMDAAPSGGRSLVPPDRTLELFVPVTDFHGYVRHFPLEDPPFVRDRTHRHILAFRHDGEAVRQLDGAYNHALAFAARATSSFPAAFPPLSFAAYRDAVTPRTDRLGDRAEEFFAMYRAAGADAAGAYFIDGGVLNNYPFGPAIEAIQRKPAASEVDRRLVYIEPDPTFPDGVAPAPATPAGPPPLIATALGAYARIPGNQPIIDELTRLSERNRVVQRVRDVIETSFQPVQVRIVALLRERGVELETLLTASGRRVAELTEMIEEASVRDAGLNYATYIRLRMALLTDAYAALVADVLAFPPTSYQAAFVASVLRGWAVATRLLTPAGPPSAAGRGLLAALDLGYHERRLRFVIAALSWWYRAREPFPVPPRDELDRAKGRIYRAIAEMQAMVRDSAGETRELLGRVFDPAVIDRAVIDRRSIESHLEAHGPDLERLLELVTARSRDRVPAIEAAMYQDLRQLAAGWSPEAIRRLLVRYIGFPYWDTIVYPIQALSNVGERDAVETYRLSPREATLLEPADKAQGKLKGVSLYHFGAFLERAYRENDYLWGRLDAAELLVKLLFHGAPSAAARREPIQRDALRAVVAEERRSLTTAGDLLRDLERQLT